MKEKKKEIVMVVMLVLLIGGGIQLFLTDEKAPKGDFLTLEKGNIAYDKYGSGDKTLIAIHGSPGTKNDYALLAPMLDEYTVYALDMYGFGESETDVKNYGAKEAAATVIEFIDTLEIEQVDFVGYSWGGAVGMHLAHEYPSRVNELMLLASMGVPEAEPTRSYFLEHLRYRISYPFVAYYPGAFIGSFGARKGFMRSFMDTDQRVLKEIMQELNQKVLIIHGESDSVIPLYAAELHNELIPQSTLITFKGGHGTIFNDPTPIAEVIRRA